MNARAESQARKRVNRYTSAPIIAVSTFFFLSIVRFIPGSPVVPTLLALGLAALSFRRPVWAVSILSLLAFAAILWQLLGFGFADILTKSLGGAAFAIFLVGTVFVILISSRLEPSSVALAILAAALMLTPYYYLSVALIIAAAAIAGLFSIVPISLTYILTMTPLLIIENAIYYRFEILAVSNGPIIFSQLSNLSGHLAEPLPGFNFFFTPPTPSPSPMYTEALKTFFASNNIFYVSVPLVLLAIVFSASVSIAGGLNSILNRLSVFERTSKILKTASPFLTSVVTPLAFVLLITVLSGRSVGGYVTGLTLHPVDSLYLVSGSLVLGALFTLRELYILRLERVEIAKTELIELLQRAKKGAEIARHTIDSIHKQAPTVDVASETTGLEEQLSYVADIEKGIETSSYESLIKWISRVQQETVPFTENIPERGRLKVLEELITISSLTATFNASLEEAHVELRFPEIIAPKSISGNMDIGAALQAYEKSISAIKETAGKLFELYLSTTNSYNTLMNRELTPPVNPLYLFDSYDYITGMKLISDEYWLNFYASSKQELEPRLATLVAGLASLAQICKSQDRGKIDDMITSASSRGPADSTLLLREVVNLKDLLGKIIDAELFENDQLERIVRTFSADATTVMHFESIGQSQWLRTLREEATLARPSIETVTNIVSRVRTALLDQADRKKKDEHSLILLSQYPVAKKVVGHMLKGSHQIEISQMPFQREAASIYLRLYSISDKSLRYDDDSEILVKKNAEMRQRS